MRQDREETSDTQPPGQAFDMDRKALLEEWVVRSTQPQDQYWIVVVPRVNGWPSYLLTAAYPEYPQSHRLAVFFSEYEAEAFIADFCERWMFRDGVWQIVGCIPAELGQIVAAEVPGIRGMELFEPDLETGAWTGPEVIVVGLTPVSDSTLDR